MGYESSTQGSHGVSDARTTAAAGGLYCIDDYMQAMASMGRRIKEEGLIRWQRRDADAAAPTAAARTAHAAATGGRAQVAASAVPAQRRYAGASEAGLVEGRTGPTPTAAEAERE